MEIIALRRAERKPEGLLQKPLNIFLVFIL